jgi:hypothetical protein
LVCIEKPFSIWPGQLRIIHRVAVFLTELMGHCMLVQEVPDVDTHPYILELSPLHRVGIDLLLPAAIGIVHKMFRPVGSWNREHRLDKELRSNEKHD